MRKSNLINWRALHINPIMLFFFVCFFATTAAAEKPLTDSRDIPKGSKLVLEKPLTIPANSAHVKLQDGQVKPGAINPVDQYYPNCSFRVRSVEQVSRTIAPDSFSVIRVRWDEERVSGRSISEFTTQLRLRSEKQPQAFELTCQQWGEAGNFEYLSVTDIKKALGSFFELRFGK